MNRIFLCAVLFCGCASDREMIAPTKEELGQPLVQAHCFFSQFQPQQFPWPSSECLNFEEVFKNFEYYETKLDWLNQKLFVTKYVQGASVEKTSYRIQKNKLKK